MPTVSIKNVPEPVLEALRQRARRNHRSLQGELMALMCDAVEAHDRKPEATVVHRGGSKTIEEIIAEQNRRWQRPFTQAPRAVDIIREERDRR